MSGSFEKLDVPPTLVSFAVTMAKTGDIISPETKKAGDKVILLRTKTDENGLPETASLLENFGKVTALVRAGKAVSCYTPGMGGIAGAIMKMSFGNGLGFRFADNWSVDELTAWRYGDFLVEVTGEADGELLGEVTDDGKISLGSESVSLSALQQLWEDRLESVFACNIPTPDEKAENVSFEAKSWPAPAVKTAKPRVLIPAFPGTNCECDSAKAMLDAGAEAKIAVINNLSAEGLARSIESFADEIRKSQIIFMPGGFSGGDEPDGSAKFITAFFRNDAVKDAVADLLDNRDGLMCGICNGFQALIKLGLVPFGKIIDTDETCPTLTFNTIGRHQSRIVHTRIASNKSPWLRDVNVGDVFTVPISHGEGKFLADDATVKRLIGNGQIATQYVDLDGNATMNVRFNPNGSRMAIEGITSPDGRVFGKMGHTERWAKGLYRNVPGNYEMKMFESAVKYFK
jgi:phosphoribosylformylglycinamidine synthase